LELDATQPDDRDIDCLPKYLKSFIFGNMRNKGEFGCGYIDKIPCPPMVQKPASMTQSERDFVKYDNSTNIATNLSAEAVPDKVCHELKDFVTLLISRSAREVQPTVFQYNPTAKVMKANGSLWSIFGWGQAAGLYPYRQRAFEIFICAFWKKWSILTYIVTCACTIDRTEFF
jgi:hypothetical protein